MSKIAIIGAGLAGIACARRLARQGHEVIVHEKSRGYGGRCATKRWNDCRVDHGAQYFTLRSDAFRQALAEHCGDAILKIEARIWNQATGELNNKDCFYHRQGNSHLVRDMAAGLTVKHEMTVTSVLPQEGRWQLAGESYDQVISTAPLPQTLKLFGLDAMPDDYIPCLALLLRYRSDGLGKTAAHYAIANSQAEDIAWSACENHKQGRIPAGNTVIVVHAAEKFSREYLEADPEEWSAILRSKIEEQWELPAATFEAQHPHRWRYARVAHRIIPPPMPPGLHFCGDALSESRVEAAWLAGDSLAQNLVELT